MPVLGAEFVDHFLENGALGVGDQVVAIAEDEGVVGDAKAWVGAGRKRGAADDHVHRAQGQALVDVGLFAQCGGGKTWMSNLPLLRFLISSAAHTDSVWKGSDVS
jgi:hypothetical protein